MSVQHFVDGMGIRTFSFDVEGVPIPQGSKTTRTVHGRSVTFEDNPRTRPWRRKVQQAALLAAGEVAPKGRRTLQKLHEPLFTGNVFLTITYRLPRPQSHFGTGRNAGLLKPGVPRYCGTKPDLSKVMRAVEDSITDAGIWVDDCKVVHDTQWKLYCDPGERVGVEVSITDAIDPASR